MRSTLVLTIIFLGAAWALAHPYVGVLLWTWVSIMSPHKLTYGAAVDFPVAAVIGGATLVGLFFTKDKKNYFLSAPAIALMLFMLWICVTYLFSFNPKGSTDMLDKVLKIDFMILVALVLLNSKQHIVALVWVLVISLGYFGVKGGIFTLATGGNYRVWGPGGFIGGNNEVALALIIVIPLMYFLRELSVKVWQRQAWLAAMSLTAIAAIGSQSRGALLGIVAMMVLLWLRGRQKIFFGTLMIVGGMLLVSFMPESWHARIDTIGEYQQDTSAMGRINAWWFAWNLAKANFFGGGFDIYNPGPFALYAPNPLDIHAAHSIYFQVLGEHGFVGLALFLTMWGLTWRWAGWLRKNATGNPETEWVAVLGSMCQVSLIGYAVGGAFLSLAYFDLPYNI
ncbi:MAG: putative O-glycosylation ligase, exosortase A system-associated, partial [Sulfuricella sp.]